MTILKAAILSVIILSAQTKHEKYKADPMFLKRQIEWLYGLSIKECAFANKNDGDLMVCAEKQFYMNYRWYVIKDQDQMIGAPGTTMFPEGAK